MKGYRFHSNCSSSSSSFVRPVCGFEYLDECFFWIMAEALVYDALLDKVFQTSEIEKVGRTNTYFYSRS